ncbi:hypothetical protein CMUS01_13633 [Colletotrichum musicola]|uniref:Uncharacterized protein n=1 Tax=Colletotrichum musicola TaxID=2175873 RepID=A0A8H6JB25_9PEZI|nr:hypothetical protein CMUS01_13633 [Colletotrichum musicola]
MPDVHHGSASPANLRLVLTVSTAVRLPPFLSLPIPVVRSRERLPDNGPLTAGGFVHGKHMRAGKRSGSSISSRAEANRRQARVPPLDPGPVTTFYFLSLNSHAILSKLDSIWALETTANVPDSPPGSAEAEKQRPVATPNAS